MTIGPGEHGGYRQPAHPAAVSGPGALSARTDGGPISGMPSTGPNSPAAAQLAASVMSDASAQPGPAAPMPGPGQLPPLDRPTERPDEPLTAGAGMAPPAQMTADQAVRLRAYLPVLIQLASTEEASPALKSYVRDLRATLG